MNGYFNSAKPTRSPSMLIATMVLEGRTVVHLFKDGEGKFFLVRQHDYPTKRKGKK